MCVTGKMINRFIYKLEELIDVIYKPNQAESNRTLICFCFAESILIDFG